MHTVPPLFASAGSRHECGIQTYIQSKHLSKELVVAVVAIIVVIIIATVIMTTEVEVLFRVPTNVAFIQTSPMKKRPKCPYSLRSYNE